MADLGFGDLTAMLAVATGITKLIDFLRTALDKADRLPKELWVGLSIAFGVAFAVVSKANLLANVDWASSVGAVTGRIATGVALGGAASGSHELLDYLSGAAKAKHAEKAVIESKNLILDDPDGGEDFDE